MAKENNGKKGGVVRWDGTSWTHRVKILNEDGSTRYTRRSGFATKEEAEESYYQYEENYKTACRNQSASRGNLSEISFVDYLKYWFEELFSLRVENTTRMIYSYVLYDLILPNVEDNIRLKYVNTDYLDKLLTGISTATESAGNKSREFLNLAMKDAVVQGIIRINPVTGTRTYPRKKPKVTVLNKENLKKLLKAAALSEWYLEILLAVFMGLRKGEIMGLKFQDLGYEQEEGFYYANIQRQITSNPILVEGSSGIEKYEVIEKEPKSEASYRKLRIPVRVYEEIEERKRLIDIRKERLGESYYDGDYISVQSNGLPHSVSALNNALSRLCQRNGLPHVTVHGLRHMYCSILLEQGVPLIKVSALAGHSSVVTTFEYYADMMDENERVISFLNDTFAVDSAPKGGEAT